MTNPFLGKGVPGGVWEKIDALAASRFWQPDEVIFREGEPAVGVHVVRSGQIDLVSDAPNRTEKPVRKSTCGDILGLGDAVAPRVHGATAIARSECETGFLPVAWLRMLLDENPVIWFSVLRLLSQDVTQSWDSLRAKRRGRRACAEAAIL